jgi:signal transduction histidine kinase
VTVPADRLAALRELKRSDLRVAALAGLAAIGGSIGATSHHRPGHGCWWASSCQATTHLDALAFALLAVASAALALRRRYPRGVLAVVFAATLAYVGRGYFLGPNYVPLAIALVNAVIAGQRLAARVALLAGWVAFLWLPYARGTTGPPTPLAAAAVAAWMLVLLAGGEAIAVRRERLAQLRRSREQEARRQASEERLRIARELHDVLAHSISLIKVQSGVALHLLEQHPEQARIALSAIDEASTDALREVRSALSVLRGSSEQPPREPTMGLTRLQELVSRAGAAGVEVALDVRGEPRPLPASVDLAAFRIVQEALTNVIRHAGARAAKVLIDYGDAELTVQIDDDGDGGAMAQMAGSGNGIVGMRERASALGGELVAGPRPAGGFSVRARLPLAVGP